MSHHQPCLLNPTWTLPTTQSLFVLVFVIVIVIEARTPRYSLRSFLFTVCTAGGHPPVEYQWKKNGLSIPNATGDSSLLLTPLKADDSGTYSVVVSDSGTDSVESQGALLTAVESLPAAGPFAAGILALALLIAAGYRSRKR